MDFISLNEFYDALGVPRIGLGDRLGWNSKDGFITRDKSEDYSYGTATNGEPCKVLTYIVEPRYEYNSF